MFDLFFESSIIKNSLDIRSVFQPSGIAGQKTDQGHWSSFPTHKIQLILCKAGVAEFGLSSEDAMLASVSHGPQLEGSWAGVLFCPKIIFGLL